MTILSAFKMSRTLIAGATRSSTPGMLRDGLPNLFGDPVQHQQRLAERLEAVENAGHRLGADLVQLDLVDD